MVTLRKCILSCDLFHGFNFLIDVQEFDQLDDSKGALVQHAHDTLRNFLYVHNLAMLQEKLKHRTYDIHEEWDTIMAKAHRDDCIWICGHCHAPAQTQT